MYHYLNDELSCLRRVCPGFVATASAKAKVRAIKHGGLISTALCRDSRVTM